MEKANHHPNAIVLCCTANWLPYAMATLLSCNQHGAARVAEFKVAVLGATGLDHEKFSAFAKTHGFDAELIDATLPAVLESFPSHRYGPAGLLRLNLDEILSPRYRRVLYLDCDVLAQGSVADIFAADLGGKALGAVEDYQSLPGPLALFSSHTKDIGLGRDAPYFNSGVLLFDWARQRENGHLRKCVKRIANALHQGRNYDLPDQDVLNLEYAGDWKRLELRFNLMAFFVDYFPVTPVFRHFSNRQKPWGPLWQPGFSAAREFYRTTFADSPWPTYVPTGYRRPSFTGTGGTILRRLDPISGRRYGRHMERP